MEQSNLRQPFRGMAWFMMGLSVAFAVMAIIWAVSRRDIKYVGLATVHFWMAGAFAYFLRR